ncbi:hypothetical protein CRENBAI_025534 [Crenichthys baileyi]|uniref:Uncharacterized protein n=1 Tax=Crenichthys baileyi TaxID=28760 RepID=A0AAV9RHP5_9TELE
MFSQKTDLRAAIRSEQLEIRQQQCAVRMLSLSHVSVKQRTADLRRSEFLPVRRSSSSILLLRERTFARWIEGSGVRSPLLRSFTRAPARFPLRRLRPSIPYSAAAPLARSSVNLGWMKDGSRGFKARGKMFEVKSTSGKLLFSADEQEVVVGAERLRVMGEWLAGVFGCSEFSV